MARQRGKGLRQMDRFRARRRLTTANLMVAFDGIEQPEPTVSDTQASDTQTPRRLCPGQESYTAVQFSFGGG